MKTANHLPTYSIPWFILIISLVLPFSVAAQDVHYRDPLEPSKGYWQLFTDAATRTTRVKFFDANKHLLYEEVIPNKYIKLTNRNINKLNQTFDLVTRNDLVSTKVKANPLLTFRSNRLTTRYGSSHHYPCQVSSSSLPEPVSDIKLNTFSVSNTSKFYLAFQNPGRKRIKIYLLNKAKQILYSESVNTANYKRQFNLVGLHTGKYTLVVTTVDRKYRFTEQIIIGPSSRTLEIKQTIPALLPVVNLATN